MENVTVGFRNVYGTKWRLIKRKMERVERKKIVTKTKTTDVNNGASGEIRLTEPRKTNII